MINGGDREKEGDKDIKEVSGKWKEIRRKEEMEENWLKERR